MRISVVTFPCLYNLTVFTLFTKSSWKLSKADWNTFCQKADSELGQGYILDSDDPVAHFTTILTSVAQTTIPKSKNRLAKHETV